MSRSFFAPSGVESSSSSSGGDRGASPPSDSSRAPFLSNKEAATTLNLGNDAAATGANGISSDRQDKSALATAGALPPILAYCTASILMTVINKYVLSTRFTLNMFVLLIQSLVGVILVRAAKSTGAIQLRDFISKDAKNWFPISCLLVLVIWTGSKALQFLSIPVYTIFKNLTIILIAYGEVFLFNARLTRIILLSFGLMVLSSIIAASADIARVLDLADLRMPHNADSLDAVSRLSAGHEVGTSDPLAGIKASVNALDAPDSEGEGVLEAMGGWHIFNSGYVWMALNCTVSAAYVLFMRKRIKSFGFKDWDTMYYNNLLSVPVLIVMSLFVEDWSVANFEKNFPSDRRTSLMTAIVFSGACAVFISYTTAWCIRATSSTTYSMVGALNKLPLALSGMVFFNDPVTTGSTTAIGTGFLAGLVYAYGKNQQAEAGRLASANGAANHGASSSLEERDEFKGSLPMHQREGGAKGRVE
ncbi:UDP-galactose transporter [Ceraceosorus guamensis]|uniref:GDP-mannose transporter n=1 Tax=Ceraceosorus guamensis TaxID=1522189 RepID=A0A316VRZ7_9BASI|nr:UDP-galactose transporter [Ceraceosorus guamensis]PWN40282.1 UDP-galactose transporter [Ceraceosorus guamensis]